MTIRNLELTFSPSSIAIVGASIRAGSVGRVVLDNIVAGGFAGAVFPVNPKYDAIAGLPCYRRVADLPAAPDIAVIATPPETVPGLIAELGGRGTKVAVVITAGIGDADGLKQRMLDAARPYLIRIIGPNTIGLLSPRAALNASFVHIAPAAGRLGLISQSGRDGLVHHRLGGRRGRRLFASVLARRHGGRRCRGRPQPAGGR